MAKIKKEGLLPQAKEILNQYFSVREMKDGSLIVSALKPAQKTKKVSRSSKS